MPRDGQSASGLGPNQTPGRRLPDGAFLSRVGDGTIKAGDYGRVGDRWFTCTPDGEPGELAVVEPDQHGNRHVVTEHEDGTISVGGSVQGRTFESPEISGVGPITTVKGWHGWLERGVWREF